jgi:DNA-binding NarL/FixJ family response regulator
VLDPLVQASLLRAAAPAGTGPGAGSGSAASELSAAPFVPPVSPTSGPESLPDDLTPREADVLRAIAAGRSNAEIATELFISAVTVKSHINHLFAKIHARSRADAVRYAYDHGLVTPGA